MALIDTQIQLAEQLLLSVLNRESVIYYNELGNRVSPPVFQRQVAQEIGEVSKLCKELGLPLLSAKVIGKWSGVAGEGLFGLMAELGIDTKGKSEKDLLAEELKKSGNVKSGIG